MAKPDTLPLTEANKPGLFYGYIIVAIVFLIGGVIGGTLYTFSIFFNPLIAEFGWTRAAVSGAASLCGLLIGFLSIVAGRLNDRFGPRIIVSGCGLFAGLGYLLMSQASAIWHLYLFYGVVLAIGMGSGLVPMMSTVARWFVRRRGLMTGIAMAGVGIGTMVVPPAASWLISSYGWRTSYAVIGFTVLAVIILAAQFLKRDPAQMRQLPLGHNEVQEKGFNLPEGGFSLQEALRTGQFWLLGIAFLGFGLFQQTIMVHTVPHAIDLGIPPTAAASIFIAIGGLSILGRVLMGSVCDRIGSVSALVICFILSTAALAWLLVADEMWMLYLFAGAFGFAYGGSVALQVSVVSELFGLSSHGVILGVTGCIFTIGGAIGPVLAGRIFDITQSYGPAFLVCAGVSVIGLILVSLLKVRSNQ